MVDGEFNFQNFVTFSLKNIQESMKETCDKVGQLQTDVAVLQTNYQNHVDEKIKKTDKKYKFIAIGMSILASVATVYNTWLT